MKRQASYYGRESGPPVIKNGYTLVELLVAATLGILLLLGTIQIFTSSRRAYIVQEERSRMQENARFALNVIKQSLQMAGYRANSQDTATAFSPDKVMFAGALLNVPEQIVGGSDGTGLNGSDVIVFRHYGNADRSVRDCLGNLATVPNGENQQPVVAQFEVALSGSPSVPNLRCRVQNPTEGGGLIVQPLVENVENMQILYGVDRNNEMTYLGADQMTANDWPRVANVRISLLLRSERGETYAQRLTDEKQVYQFNGENMTAPDYRIRQVFTTTVQLRNRDGY